MSSDQESGHPDPFVDNTTDTMEEQQQRQHQEPTEQVTTDYPTDQKNAPTLP